MSVVEELPFGWDDGEFISPFVATSSEDSEALAEWIWQQLNTPSTSTSTSSAEAAPRRAHISLVDLGCGDGTALVNTLASLTTLVTTCPSFLSGGEVCVSLTGIDLDDVLIAQAQQRAVGLSALVPASSARSATLRSVVRFESGDVRHFDMDEVFPLPPSPSPSLAASTEASTGCGSVLHVLFVYLLPDALEQLRESLETIVLKRGWVLVSNRWPVPYLTTHLTGTPGHLHVYQCRTQE